MFQRKTSWPGAAAISIIALAGAADALGAQQLAAGAPTKAMDSLGAQQPVTSFASTSAMDSYGVDGAQQLLPDVTAPLATAP